MKIYFDDLNGFSELTPDVMAAKASKSIVDGKEERFIIISFADGSEKLIPIPEDESGRISNDYIRRIAQGIDIGRKILFVV